MAVADGQPANDLHCTLAFLPDGLDDNQLQALTARLSNMCGQMEPLSGEIGGAGAFAEGPDGHPMIGLPDVVGLADLRVGVTGAMDDLGIPYAKSHGFTPHVTLAYADTPTVDHSVVGKPVSFNAVTIKRGPEKTVIPFGTNMTAAPVATVPGMSDTMLEDPVASSAETFSGAPVWEGVLGVEGYATDDGRYLIPGQISERDLPLTLMAQTVNEEGHTGAAVCGRIEQIWRVPNPDLSDTAVEIWGRGPFDESEFALDVARMVDEQTLRGVSLDLSITDAVPLDPSTFEPITAESDLVGLVSGDVIVGMSGKIMGATICAHPAFAEATLRVVPQGNSTVLVASTFGMSVTRLALTASAAGLAPLRPPVEWFQMPEPKHPTPLTVTEDGRVFGHLALWESCHAAYKNVCEKPPRSRSNYAYFHLGRILTENGEQVSVGRMTVGKARSGGGHYWDLAGGSKGAIEHYDRTGSVAAFVRATDGKYGIWLCGAVRSDAPPEAIRDMRANPPSGDWRYEKGGLELVAALSVPVPGYPVPYAEMSLVASGDIEEVHSLIASGYSPEGATFMPSRAEIRKISMLTDEATGMLASRKKHVARHPFQGLRAGMRGGGCVNCGLPASDPVHGPPAVSPDPAPAPAMAAMAPHPYDGSGDGTCSVCGFAEVNPRHAESLSA